MTTIVADRHGMASDSQLTDEKAATTNSVEKFWRIRGWLIGAAGTYSDILNVMAEIRHHKNKSPTEVLRTVEIKMGKDADAELLLLSPSGKLYFSENGTDPMPLTDGFAALGTGAQGALVAMHLGCTPKEAVNAVKKVDPSTGGRTITRKL